MKSQGALQSPLALTSVDADGQRHAWIPGQAELPAGATASLALEDGTTFPGRTATSLRPIVGEAVFTTASSGYPESMTDPSYRGQILVFTYPHLGIYGVDESSLESRGVYANALVCHTLCRTPSLQGARERLEDTVARAGRGILEGVDTRAVTRYLRTRGTMLAGIVPGKPGPAEVRRMLASAGSPATRPLAACDAPRPSNAPSWPRIVVADFGLKGNILRSLRELGAEALAVDPERSSAAEVLALAPDGILLSNGPGDPGELDRQVAFIQGLLGRAPIMGICLGHQLLGRALGATTEKLPFGHRGVNQPVRDLIRNRTWITSQNHGYALSRSSLEAIDGVRITHVHAGDGSVEGFDCPRLRCRAVQFHPEARPGPVDARYLFEDFLGEIREGRSAS